MNSGFHWNSVKILVNTNNMTTVRTLEEQALLEAKELIECAKQERWGDVRTKARIVSEFCDCLCPKTDEDETD